MSKSINNRPIQFFKSVLGRLLSGFLKAIIVGEAIARLAVITKAEIIYDGVSHAFV